MLETPEIREAYGRTLDGNHTLYIGSKVESEFGFHVFGSHAIMKLVHEEIPPEQRTYLIDGTFKIVPRGFAQLLIIAIEYKNDVSIYLISVKYSKE